MFETARRQHTKPHSRPLVLVGAGLLWAGWFGFNAGSALTARQSASVVFLNTAVAAGAGILGILLIGLFATDAAPNKVNGLFYGGGFGLLGIQTIATLAVLGYSFIVTWIIAKVLNVTMGLRIHEADELRGIDIAAHSEAAYLSDEEPVELGSLHRG
ncbi:hypothetical protein ACX801_22795 [Arthrobacter bambusae]